MKGESSMKVSDKNQNVIFRMFFKIAARHAGAIGIYVFIFLLLTFWITGSARQTEKNMFSTKGKKRREKKISKQNKKNRISRV